MLHARSLPDTARPARAAVHPSGDRDQNGAARQWLRARQQYGQRDGHTLRDAMDRTETLTGCAIERTYVDKGYRGHDAQNPRRVFISGQKRGVFGAIKRELRRRSAIEPIIGHLKAEGHLGRCYLKGRAGDAANVVLSAVGHNFRRILAWFRELLRLLLVSLWLTLNCPAQLNPAS
ncbi:hypothetical protein ACVIYL_004577 [Bradyrhizobium sp. USDA 3315]